MNETLLTKVKSLNEDTYQTLMQKVADAPLLKSYVELLRSAENKKYSTQELVKLIYGKVKKNEEAVYENRFYKLRKKLIDFVEQQSSVQFQPQFYTEEAMQRDTCRTMISKGQFADAEKQLTALQKTCFERNIFELLPEIIELLIHCKQSLNKLNETDDLYVKFDVAVKLYTHIFEAKILTRKIYEINLKQGIKATEFCLKQMDRIARINSAYPRFKLMYNFVAGYYKVGAGGNEDDIKSNVTSRHIQAAKKLMLQYPKMPIVSYAPDYVPLQQYRMTELEAMTHFRAFRFKEAANAIYDLLLTVSEADYALKRMFNEVLIVNAIHIQVAAKNPERALACVQIYFKFLRANKQHERIPRAYCELANVVATLQYLAPHTNFKTLLTNIELLENDTTKDKTNEMHGAVLFLKLKLLWMMKNYSHAIKLLSNKQLKEHFQHDGLWQLVKDVLDYASPNSNLVYSPQELKTQLRKLKHNSKRAENITIYNWLELIIQ